MDVHLLRQRHHQRFGHQLAQQFAEELRRFQLGQLAGDAVAQNLLRKRGFQVERQLHPPAVDQGVHRIAAHAQRHGALDAAVGKADLAELLAHGFIVYI